MLKQSITAGFVVFATVTLLVQITKEFRPTVSWKPSEGLNVICTHATVRCPTCRTMERLTTETLKEYFQNELNSKTIVFQEIDYEQPETADFSQEFKIATASIVLVDVEDGKTIASKNLANESWNTYTDESAFKEMLRENIDAMLKHEETESMKSSDIMVFEPDEEEDIILPQ